MAEIAPGRWRLRIFVGNDPATGKPRQRERKIHADGRRAAERALDEFKAELAAIAPAGKSVTVGRLMDEHQRSLEARGRAPRTLHGDRRIAERYIRPRFGARQVSELTVRDIEDWMMALHEGGLSPSSVRRVVAVLGAALGEAVRWQWVATNVAQLARKPATPPLEHRALTKAEVQQLLAAATEADPVSARFMALLVMTAARAGEAAALRWSDVDLEASRVHIRRSLYRAGTERGEGPPKGRRSGVVPLSGNAVGILRSWRDELDEQAGDRYVVSRFPDGSRPLNAETYSQFQGRLAKRLGIQLDGRNPFRHAAASWIQDEGISPGTAARILRHADRGVTLASYTHPSDEAQSRAAAALDGALVAALPGTADEAYRRVALIT